MSYFRVASLVIALALFAVADRASGQVVNSQWNTGNGNWNVATNWTPNAIPDDGGGFTYNVQIGNLAPANAQVTFIPEDGTFDIVTSLDITDQADLFTNSFQILVIAQTTIDGAGSTIRVDPHATPGTIGFQTLDLDLNNGGGLVMNGGFAAVTRSFEINAGSVLSGFGTVNLGDFDFVVEQAFENSGLIQVAGTTLTPGTLTLHANASDVIDLDGTTETGVVDVANVAADVELDTLTLVVDGPLLDAFSGTLQIGQRDTATFNANFTMSGADVQMDGGTQTATMNGPGDVTSITSSAFTIAGSAVIGSDMTFSGVANTFTTANASTLTLGGTVAVVDASMFVFGQNSFFVVDGATSITEATGDFDWDGGGAVTTTVNGLGNLALAVDQIDIGNDIYNGTLNLNDGGDISVNVTAASWEMDGILNKNGASVGTISGDRMLVGGTINANAGTLDLPSVTLQSTANVNVAGTLTLGSASELAGPATLTGAGLLRMESTSTVSASTTINTTSFDWDGLGSGTAHAINDGVVFTVNSTVWDPDDTGDVDDNITLGSNGAQIVVNNIAAWTMSRTLTTNTPDVGVATIGGTSRMILSGALSNLTVNGDTNLAARVTFGASSTTTIAATQLLTLKGGGEVDANEIAGGTINGPGTLSADTGKVLRGFGTINSIVDFNGDADVVASGGLLDLNGNINDVGTLRTSGAAAVLDLPAAFSTNVTDDGILMAGGTLQGGSVAIAATSKSLRGSGTATNQLDNNGAIEAQTGTLLLNNAASDYDGTAGGVGQLRATGGGTLEILDNATFGFIGDVIATGGGRVFTNGFALDFNPTSIINLTAATYESTSSTDVGGTVTIGVGADSTIKVQNNFFLTFESGSATTLNGNLRLVNNNINVDAGATFGGSGAVVVPDGSHLVADNLANIGVLLDMQGAFRPGNFEGIGRVDLFEYQQSNTGKLFVEITGTALNAFDRLAVGGDAVLDGYLNIDIDEVSPGVPFVPVLGQTFNIITTSGIRSGTFDYADVSGMPPGLTFHINYLANAVQLQVVSTPIFSADFDEDGDVDATDLAIWRGAFHLNQLGDADGDNDSDGNDFLIWQRQLGSIPAVPVAAAVPEPGAATIAAAGAITAIFFQVLKQARGRRLV